MLHEALMLEIYRQALNAGALPTARPRSTESANSSERCPSHDSNSSENGRDGREASGNSAGVGAGGNVMPMLSSPSGTYPTITQNLSAQPPSMEAYLHMVAAAAQQYGFPLGATAVGSGGPRLPLALSTEAGVQFKLPQQISPTASSNHSEALDFRTNFFARVALAGPTVSEDDEEDDAAAEANNNPLDLSVGGRKRSAEMDNEPDSTHSQTQAKRIFKNDSSPISTPVQAAPPPLLPTVNPYLAAVAAANIFRTGQFPDWNSKNDLVVDPLDKMSDIVRGPKKEKCGRATNAAAAAAAAAAASTPPTATTLTTTNAVPSTPPSSTEGITKARHNIWQSHWQNKGVASSVFRCVWCKQSFSTLESLTTHMKDSKHCGVNVPPFGNLPNTNPERLHQPNPPQSNLPQHSHNLRKQASNASGGHGNTTSSPAAKNAFQYRGDAPTPLPRKLVRGQNVWLGKGVEQAMQILKCMRCGESFRSLGEMTKHMQETQHYTNILSQEQTVSMKSSASADAKDGHNSLSSEESRTLSAVLTCKVCDKAFNSLGDLSNHMAKNNHYAEPLMQSMNNAAGNRKRPAPKKREKSLPVRKLLEMKGAQSESDALEAKMQRAFDSTKRMSLESTGTGSGAGGGGMGPSNEKSEAAMFAERMRQYISGVKSSEEAAKANLSVANLLSKTKSPELEASRNGVTKTSVGSSSVLSAIEQMFTTSFETPPRQTSLPAASPSNSSTKNTSPVASSILKRLGIDESVDYNKPLMDTPDPYFPHYRYTNSDRSGSECSGETHIEGQKSGVPIVENVDEDLAEIESKTELKDSSKLAAHVAAKAAAVVQQKLHIKEELHPEILDDEQVDANIQIKREQEDPPKGRGVTEKVTTSKSPNIISPKTEDTVSPQSPTESHRSATPKSPASSIKSYDGEKKYPSDSLNALSSMFDSLGNATASNMPATRSQSQSNIAASNNNKSSSPENHSSSANSLAALRQFCVKKEKTS